MTLEKNKPTGAVAATVSKPENGSENIKHKIESLTRTMMARYFVIYTRYGELAVYIVLYIKEKRGKGIWEAFLASSNQVNTADGEEQELYEAITPAFELDSRYTEYDIVKKILDVRKELGLDDLTDNITDVCMKLFKLLFLYKVEMVPNAIGEGKHPVYTPNIAVLA
jgi:hypothetical protein